jgi:hypothetical protein
VCFYERKYGVQQAVVYQQQSVPVIKSPQNKSVVFTETEVIMQGSVPLVFFAAGVGRAFQATQKLAPGIEKAFQPQKNPATPNPPLCFTPPGITF